MITSWNGQFYDGSGKVLDANTSSPIPGAYVGFDMAGEFGNPGNPIVSQADGSYSADRVFPGISGIAIAMARGYQTYVNTDYYVAPHPQQPIQAGLQADPLRNRGELQLGMELNPAQPHLLRSDLIRLQNRDLGGRGAR